MISSYVHLLLPILKTIIPIVVFINNDVVNLRLYRILVFQLVLILCRLSIMSDVWLIWNTIWIVVIEFCWILVRYCIRRCNSTSRVNLLSNIITWINPNNVWLVQPWIVILQLLLLLLLCLVCGIKLMLSIRLWNRDSTLSLLYHVLVVEVLVAVIHGTVYSVAWTLLP